MSQPPPTILALDFDGVLCDGLIEYFQTAWRAYCQIDSAPPTAPDGLATEFYRLRPVIESGWEMPLLIRSRLLGISEAEILEHWKTIAPEQAQAVGMSSKEIGATVDRVRDEWIAADLGDWLGQHRFYPGVIDRLQQVCASPVHPVIITTKEGRFVRRLLQQQGIDLPETQIFGKEVGQPKAQTLRELQHQFRQTTEHLTIWFVEDRLQTLQSIQPQADLSDVTLFLADWGYNLPTDREIAAQDPRIHLLSLSAFAQDFSAWCPA